MTYLMILIEHTILEMLLNGFVLIWIVWYKKCRKASIHFSHIPHQLINERTHLHYTDTTNTVTWDTFYLLSFTTVGRCSLRSFTVPPTEILIINCLLFKSSFYQNKYHIYCLQRLLKVISNTCFFLVFFFCKE